ncbi:MAG: glycosyltransferase family 2 protein [Gemmataceae bacterium]|nr:glycosyltransferase family 2 protein [Gemmataceae bacterium]
MSRTELAPAPVPMLTVIVPVYNEARTVDESLQRLLAGPYAFPDMEVLVVDDGSTDGTAERLANWTQTSGVLILRHVRNRGKGAAIRTALERARGRITIIQDADLEYDPAELPELIEPIRRGEAQAVFGSRYLRPAAGASLQRHGISQRPTPPWTKFRLAVSILNALVRLLYGVRLTDEATCYKALPTSLLRALDLQAQRFEICPEVTAKLCRLGTPILEVPIAYHPRPESQGKKIRWRDAWDAVVTLVAWRFRKLPSAMRAASFDAVG